MSETCETVVPEAPPKYNTLEPGLMWVSPTPPIIAAAYNNLIGDSLKKSRSETDWSSSTIKSQKI